MPLPYGVGAMDRPSGSRMSIPLSLSDHSVNSTPGGSQLRDAGGEGTAVPPPAAPGAPPASACARTEG